MTRRKKIYFKLSFAPGDCTWAAGIATGS